MSINIKLNDVLHLLSVPLSQAIRGFLIVFLLSYYLPVEDIGLWGQLFAIHSLLYIFVNLNLTQAMTRFFPSIKRDVATVSSYFWGISSIVILNLLIVITIILIFDSKTYLSLRTDDVVILLCFLILFENLFNLIYCYFRSLQLYSNQTQVVLLRTFFEIFLVGGGIVYLGENEVLDIFLTLVLFTFSLFLSSVVSFVLAIRDSKLILVKPRFSFLNNYLKFGIPLLPSSLSYWAVNISDRLMISFFLGPVALGYYFLANRFGMMLLFPLTPMNTILQTECSVLFDKNQPIPKKSLTVKYMLLMLVFTLTLYTLIYCIRNYLSFILSDAVFELLPFIFVSLFLFHFISIMNVFNAVEKKVSIVGTVWTFMGLGNLAFNIYFIPNYGIVGALYSSIIVYFIGCVYLCRKTY